MVTKQGYEDLLSEVKLEFPDFTIVKKQESAFMKFLDVCLKMVSLGRAKNFMDSFITTIGNKIYVPNSWDGYSNSTKAITVRHERIHMRQARKYGKFMFSLLYLLSPVPMVFAYFRTMFEKEAYEESLRAYNEYYGAKFFTPSLRTSVVEHFTTAEYAWMWPWKRQIEQWYDDVVADITKLK